jgi:hypothetical protein
MHILIAGDSWSCGEWGDPLPGQLYYQNIQGVRHGGLSQYLREDGHTVTLVGEGSSSNSAQVDRVIQLEKKLKEFHKIIWFHTDPLRDIDQKEMCNSREGLKQQREKLDRFQYQKLQNLGIEIFCLGGCSPIKIEQIQEYTNLKVIIANLQTWFLPNVKTMDPLGRWWKYQNPNLELLSDFEEQERLVETHIKKARDQKTTQEHLLFWPDGLHPNREAHLRLYNYMKDLGIFL